MKRLKKLVFYFEDGTAEAMDDDRACALFQSRCNSSGIMMSLEEYVYKLEEKDGTK